MARQDSRPEPHEVFTPSSIPLAKDNVYATRVDPEKGLRKAVQRRQIPVVFGDFGVGKTTLVQKFFQATGDDSQLVYIPTTWKQALPNIFAGILDVLGYSVEVETTRSSSRTAGGGFTLKIFTANASKNRTDESRSELVVTSPSDLKLLEIFNDRKLAIVIDEMHKATDQLRADLANFIKAIKSTNHEYPTLVLIGTTLDAEHLVQHDPGIDRHVVENLVPIMADDEARFIVDEGFGRLGLTIDNALADRIVASAAGAPTIVHSLCLEAAEQAILNDRSEVLEGDCVSAVKAYLGAHGRRLASSYLKAIETTGPKQYRKRILSAVSEHNGDYATMDDIRSGVSNALGESTPSTALSGPLKSLKGDTCGKILQDVERIVGGQRIHNLTTFSDPMMKSFVRFMGKVDQTGLMPATHELVAIKESNGELEVGPPES